MSFIYFYLLILVHPYLAQWHRMFPDDPQGGYPHKSLSNAREEAERLWNLRSQGLDPRAERRRLIEQKQREEEAARLQEARRLNVRQLFDRWRDTELQPRHPQRHL
jgi:hypothetical protein